MNNLRTEPSTRTVVRCPRSTTERLYCDNCDVCHTVPVTFRDVLNLQRNEGSANHFCTKYKQDNDELLGQYENGETILHWLVMYTDLYSLSRTPLLQSWEDYKNMITCLLEVAPQLCSITNNEGETPLCAATKHCTQTSEVTELLISQYKPSEVNIPDNNGNTPLFNLLNIGGLSREPEFVYIQAIQRFHMNEIHNGGRSEKLDIRLHMQSVMSNFRYFLVHSNICTENKDGLNILQFSLKEMSKLISLIDTIQILMRQNRRNRMLDLLRNDEQSIMLIKEFISLYQRFIDTLIDKETPVCSTSGNHALSHVPTLKITNKILDKDSTEINKRDPNGCTPLTNVINRDQFEDKQKIIELMKSKGAEEENKFEIVNKILDQTPGYDVNMRDPNGATMLINYAANTDIVNKLLQLGADVKNISNQNIDLITSACQSKNLEVVQNIEILSTLVATNASFIPSKHALLAVARNYYLSSEDTAEWMEVFRTFLSLPNCTGEILNNSLPEIVQYGENQSQKLQDLLYDIVRIRNIGSTEKFGVHKVDIYNLDLNVPLNPFSSILIDMSRCSWYFDFIQRVLDANLPVINTPDNCINPLTALLLGNLANNNDTETNKIANKLIERGVNINSSVLNIIDADFSEVSISYQNAIRVNLLDQVNNVDIRTLIENVMFMKNTLRVPDALFIAMMTDRFELTVKLLPSWFGPPMALFILRSWNLKIGSFIMLAKIFAGPLVKIQRSTLPMEGFIADFVMHAGVKIRSIQDIVTASRRIQAAITSGQAVPYADNPPEIFSLRDLSLYAVRMTMSERAARTGERLPDLLEQLSVPPLISKILALK